MSNSFNYYHRFFSVIHKFPKIYLHYLYDYKSTLQKCFLNIILISVILCLRFSSSLLTGLEHLKQQHKLRLLELDGSQLCFNPSLGCTSETLGKQSHSELVSSGSLGEKSACTRHNPLCIPRITRSSSYFWEVKTAQWMKPLRANLLGWRGHFYTSKASSMCIASDLVDSV